MAFFDPKAKNIANYQRSIDEKKVSVSRYYDEIGRYYYKQYKDLNVDNTKDINNRCDAITKLTNEIEELNVKILYEKGLKLCPNCRTENNLEYTFCFKCGSRFDEEAKKVAEPAPAVKAEPAKVEETPAPEAEEPAPAQEETPAPDAE